MKSKVLGFSTPLLATPFLVSPCRSALRAHDFLLLHMLQEAILGIQGR